MELHTPGWYPAFRCLASACPHTCCAWWEVPVDGASARFYENLPGPEGDRLRAMLSPDGEGGACFRLTGGKCPMLTGEGLCSLQLRWGEESIPAICREHPRFSYDYGTVREVGLCASCPEAARLILEEDFSLTVSYDDAPAEEETDPLLPPLLEGRETALSLLTADAPLGQRLEAVLLCGNDLQNALDGEDLELFAQVNALYREEFPRLDAPLPRREDTLKEVFACLRELTVLREDWAHVLDEAAARLDRGGTLPPPPETPGSRTAAYFLYRHWLRALNDGDLLSWCEFAVLATAAAGALAPLIPGGFPEAFRLLCLEVEHAQCNLDALQDALWHAFTLEQLLSLTRW